MGSLLRLFKAPYSLSQLSKKGFCFLEGLFLSSGKEQELAFGGLSNAPKYRHMQEQAPDGEPYRGPIDLTVAGATVLQSI